MISVIIPAYNEEDNIAHCLDAFLGQTTKRDFEIVLVNNASTDKTAEIAERYKDKFNLNVVFDPIKGRGHARYVGFNNAKGEIIISSDSDAVVPENWIEELASALDREGSAVAVTGTCKIIDCDEKTNRRFNYFQPFVMKAYRLVFGYYWLNGFSFGIRKEAYIESGGFDSNLNAQEDIDLSFKVSRIGRIIFLPNVPIVFSGRRFKDGLVRGLLSYLKSFFSYWRGKKDVQLDDPR